MGGLEESLILKDPPFFPKKKMGQVTIQKFMNQSSSEKDMRTCVKSSTEYSPWKSAERIVSPTTILLMAEIRRSPVDH